jgi:hypothetical protein
MMMTMNSEGVSMTTTTIEGIIENGAVRLPPNIHLPERSKVLVIVPGIDRPNVTSHVASPRLAHPEQAADFAKTVVEEKG